MHVHEPSDTAPLWALAQAGKLAGVTVINNLGLANRLAAYVPYVVYRPVPDVSAYKEWGGDSRLIYQFGNEENNPNDCNHWLQNMQAADAAGNGRKLAIFVDSVGWTTDTVMDIWQARHPALVYAKAHGHYVSLHAYGISTDKDNVYHPLTEPSGWVNFGGRWIHLYSLMPPEAQPDLILTECGSGGWEQNATPDQWLADVRHMNAIAQDYPFLKAFCWWDFGRIGEGFDHDLINNWVHLLL